MRKVRIVFFLGGAVSIISRSAINGIEFCVIRAVKRVILNSVVGC